MPGWSEKYRSAPNLPVTLPSEVIANRPDIRQSERLFAAATARVGVAVADMYPHFSIPLSLTPQTSTLTQLFQARSLVWQIGLSATDHVYTGGALSARVRQARERAEEARFAYQQTVLRAFQDVEDGLIDYTTKAQRDVTLKAAAEDSELAFQRSSRLYKAGLTDFLHVLVDERAAYAARIWRRRANWKASTTRSRFTRHWGLAGRTFIPPMNQHNTMSRGLHNATTP